MGEYPLGKRVLFTDENQCEIIGEIIDREQLEDRLVLMIDLEGEEGTYEAHVLNSSFRSTRNREMR